MIEKYYTDNRIYDFEADITTITEESNGTFSIVLNQTYFYPEGGGQPADRGFIDSLEVIDVQKIDGSVIHTLKQRPSKKTVKCSLDREHRDYFMVQHTGQHLISAVLKNVMDINTLSVHLGLKYTTIEIDRPEISDAEIKKIEDSVYDLITNGNRVIYHETDDEGLKNFNIRRESKYMGYIRIVEIEGYDSVPCGGVHLKNLYKIGLIKIIGFEKIRGHIRLNILIGKSAYRDYQTKNSVTASINRELSTQTEEIPQIINSLKKSISELKSNNRCISLAYSKTIIDSIISSEENTFEFDNLPTDLSQKISSGLTQMLQKPILIVNTGNRVNWYLLDSKEPVIDFNSFRQNILPIINGKGGGKKSIWQGSGDKDNVSMFIKSFKSWLSNNNN